MNGNFKLYAPSAGNDEEEILNSILCLMTRQLIYPKEIYQDES